LTFSCSDSCTPIEEQLCEKLEKNSTNIRLKTLRIIKSVCENGSPNFKRDMQRQTSGIRSCMQWKGPPHPTLGDAVNKMVRDAAQECINAVFDTESKAAGPKISAQGSRPYNPSCLWINAMFRFRLQLVGHGAVHRALRRLRAIV
jgi:hypothetical protein